MATHVHTSAMADGKGTVTTAITKTAEGQIFEDIPVGASQTDKQIDIAFPVARLVSFLIKATMNVTIKTNNSTDPDDTLTIAAGESIEWHNGMPYDCPLTVDVTALFVTNTLAGVITTRVLFDPTP